MLFLLRRWRKRQQQRRELSMLKSRDFGDLAVPPALLANELGCWPSQPPSPQWRTVVKRSDVPDQSFVIDDAPILSRAPARNGRLSCARHS